MNKLKLLIVKHYDSIKLGLLVGVLISQFILITKTSESINQVVRINERIEQQIKDDNEARIQARQDNKARDLETRQFICRLIRELLRDAVRQPELDSCNSVGIPSAKNSAAQNSVSGIQADPTNTSPAPLARNNPTTSLPPEPDNTEQPQPGLIKGLTDTTFNLLKGLEGVL